MKQALALLTLLSCVSTVSLAADLSAENADPDTLFAVEPPAWAGLNAVVFVGGGYMKASDSLGLDASLHSAVLGGSIGYDHQIDNVVFGVSVEGLRTNFRETTNSGLVHQKARWLGTATMRMGLDLGRVLPYVAVGGGAGTYEVDIPLLNASERFTDYWFVMGAGAEMRVRDGFFARLDYKHYTFKEQDFDVSSTAFTAEGEADTITLGLGYRF